MMWFVWLVVIFALVGMYFFGGLVARLNLADAALQESWSVRKPVNLGGCMYYIVPAEEYQQPRL